MPLALYMDAHVPRSITVGRRSRGVDVLTAQEDGAGRLDDPELLDRATKIGRPLFTRDDDLLAEAHRRQDEGIEFLGVTYAHQLYVSIGKCIGDLVLIAKVGEAEDLRNRVVYLPLIYDTCRNAAFILNRRNRGQDHAGRMICTDY